MITPITAAAKEIINLILYFFIFDTLVVYIVTLISNKEFKELIKADEEEFKFLSSLLIRLHQESVLQLQ